MEKLKLNNVYNMDCLEGLRKLEDNSINLCVIDPPYNIKKAKWDSWKTVKEYVEFMGEVFTEIERVLKDNGSFYFFHNDFLQIVELQNWLNKNSSFIFKQFLIWNKRFEGVKNLGFLNGFIEPEGLRNYQKMAEYCLFYTFQDDTGRKLVDHDVKNYKPLREYSKKVKDFIGLNKKEIIEKIGQRADHFFRFSSSQFSLPTNETYQELINVFNIDKMEGFKTIEELRKEYEEQRYTFNNQKTHHSVWDYEIATKQGHITPKPVELIENIIKHSSNENDIVLDCFMGSFTTAISCLNTNRQFIGFELDEKYYELGQERIKKHKEEMGNDE